MAIDIQRIGAIRIFVRDLTRAREFYAGLLKLPERVDGEEFSAFRLAGVDIVIEIATGDQAEMPGRFTGFSFAVADIDSALAHIADPGGNELTLVQYPAEAPA